MTASESDGAGGLAAALAPPRLAHDREYARGKAAVAAALFDEPQPRPTIGRYELRRRLGAGGMGEVYAAFDPALGREVALKLTRSDRASPGAQARLVREARLLARLSHPHVVQIHEVGAVDGHVYIAMALVRGRTLRAWQREAARPWRATVRLYVAAARGLAAAHAAGLVHCDFKPDNALVDADEHVYVVDFGLARVTGPAAEAGAGGLSEGAGSTATGGTVGYAAPEQLAGRTPDARSDIYSLCCSLFEALHGWVPGRDLAPPGRRRLEHPRWLDRELARGMAAAPERRHPSLESLCAALERDPGRTRRRLGLAGGLLALGGLAGAWSPGPPPAVDACAAVDRRLDAAWNPTRRAALAAAFRGSGLALAPDAWRRVDARLDAYVRAWQGARRQLCETSALHSPGGLEVRRICLERSADALAALLARLTAAVLDRLGDQGPRRAELVFALGVAAAHAGRHEEAARLQREVLARLEAVDGPQGARIRAEQSLANAYEALGREAEARAAFEAALAAAEGLYGARHPQYARVAHDMATLLSRQGEGVRARGLLAAALAVWTEAHGAAGLEAARVHTALAHEAVQAGEFGRAERHSRRALAIYGRVLPPGHEDLPAARINLGVVAFWRGDHEGALAAYREAAALQDRSLPAGHVHRAITASNIGESLLALDRPTEALAAFAEAEPIARAAATVDDELLGLILAGKGAALLAVGQVDPARAALTEARAVTARVAGSAAAVAKLDARLAALGRAR
ncbi:protein kinase domain-containing protein [Nannocystis pusilla]|uniref:serine/threonine-protein kinase n=1 Tax=Nannocystis pusilla TaxID=889268 RepID=UPI003DA39D99